MLGGTLADVGTKYNADIAKLLAFARTQQAKGMKEAARLLAPRRLHYEATRQVDTLVRGIQLNEVSGCIETITAQATAREQGLPSNPKGA